MITNLTNRLANTNISIGMYKDICIMCHESTDRSEIEKCVGELTGKKIIKSISVQGEEVCICKDCIEKLYGQIKKI